MWLGKKWAKPVSISRPHSNVAKKSIARLEIKRSTAQRPLTRRFARAHIRLSQLLSVLAHSSVFWPLVGGTTTVIDPSNPSPNQAQRARLAFFIIIFV